jgi:hypothetical protein
MSEKRLEEKYVPIDGYRFELVKAIRSLLGKPITSFDAFDSVATRCIHSPWYRYGKASSVKHIHKRRCVYILCAGADQGREDSNGTRTTRKFAYNPS